MDPFGFAHLRGREKVEVAPTICNEKYKKDSQDVAEMTKLRVLSLRRLYYPINTPVCRYQKKLILDSLYNNILIALPKELDAFFVAAVTMLNFRRWFPLRKVVCICSNFEASQNAAKRFVEITGYAQDICIYGNLKKSDRYLRWTNEDIIFATAENLVADIKDEALAEICLMVVEDAHRAITGCHPVCELIRNCIFVKAKFRVLAYTDCKIEKVGQLQLIVMNLQIDLIRSLSSLRDDVSLAVASPRMQKLFVPHNEDMRRVGKEIIKVLEPLASLLHESGVFPVTDLKKLGNFSTDFLQKLLQTKECHLTEIYSDFFDVLSAYDILLCEGLTAFGNRLQALAARSATIAGIVDSNDIIKEAFFRPTISRPSDLQYHKLDMLVKLLKETRTRYDSQKSTVVVLCRDRDTAFLDGLLAGIKRQLSTEISGFAFFLGNKVQHKISEQILRDRLCNVIIMPCGFDAVELNIGYVDSLICMDEGLSTLHYTGAIKVGNEGSLYALCSAGYEMNIYSFLTAQGAIDCILPECIKGVQLCTDVLRMLPAIPVPEIVEFWAEKVDKKSGLLTAVEKLDFEERLSLNGPLDKSKLFKRNRDLLGACVRDTLLWQDRPQHFTLLGHSGSTLKLTNILNSNSKFLEEQAKRLQNRHSSKWLDEDSQSSAVARTEIILSDSEEKTDTRKKYSGKLVHQKRPAKNLSEKGGVKRKVPRISRIESASFTLLKILKPQLTPNDFVNPVAEMEEYRERQKQMAEIIAKLNHLIRL